MNFRRPFSEEEMDKAQKVPATPDMFADAWFAGVTAYGAFDKKFVRPHVMERRVKPSPRDEAIIDCYYGIMGYLLSLDRLRDPWHVQAISSCARSIFEIYADLRLLHQDSSSTSSDRFHAFTQVERYRVAKARIDYFDANPKEDPGDLAEQRKFVQNDEGAIKAQVARLWGKMPRHWSGLRETKERAATAGCLALYWRFYAHLSWFVHTAKVGAVGVSKADVHMVVTYALECVRLTVTDMLDIVGRELEINTKVSQFHEKVDYLRAVFLYRLAALRLGCPERFDSLDPEGPKPRPT